MQRVELSIRKGLGDQFRLLVVKNGLPYITVPINDRGTVAHDILASLIGVKFVSKEDPNVKSQS